MSQPFLLSGFKDLLAAVFVAPQKNVITDPRPTC